MVCACVGSRSSTLTRSRTGSGPDQQEVEELKTEVSSLKHRLQTMNESIQELTDLVNELVLDKKPETPVAAYLPLAHEENPKKRKVAVKMEPEFDLETPYDVTSMVRLHSCRVSWCKIAGDSAGEYERE
jgi:hypothetical protein